MSKRYKIVVAIISFVGAAYFNFNNPAFYGFLIATFINGFLIFIFLFSILAIFFSFKNNKPKSGRYVLYIFCVGIVYFFFGFGLGLPALTPAHFRTNTLTNKCEYGGYNSSRVKDPWYFSAGCDLQKEELIQVVRKSSDFERIRERCAAMCFQPDAESLLLECKSSILTHLDGDIINKGDITCSDVLSY